MSDFLDNLHQGLPEAQRKFEAAHKKFTATQSEFQAIQQRLAADQAEYQAAVQEFQAYQTLIRSLTPRDQAAPAAPGGGLQTVPIEGHGVSAVRVANRVAPSSPVSTAVNQNMPLSQSPTDDNNPEINKTEAVRVLLRQHPNGMTPAEMWKHLRPQMSNRVYLYSVLKRLKDRGDVRERRGKYYFNLKLEENQNQNQTVVQ
jgi:hypothetical protein